MKTFRTLNILALIGLLLLGLPFGIKAQDVDKAKYPDWRPFDASMQKLMPSTKVRGAAKSANATQRPDHINNALSMYFPPVFNQSGGSCGSAQAIGYMFTHEMNSWRNKDASLIENQYPTHFTWLFTTPGVGKIEQMVNNGIPSVAVYGGRTYSSIFGYQTTDNYDFGWMQGYDKWYSAMFNRSKEFFYGPRVTMNDDAAREQLKQWLWNRWGTEGYHDGGVAGFGVASGCDCGKIPSTAVNNEIGVAGKCCIKRWGKTYDHGLTICGYDDRIEFDLDSNGVYGEKDKNETGAWIICNSWGSGWQEKGFVYCPYAFSYCVFNMQTYAKELNWATELYVHRPDYEPQRTIKVLMDYDHRWELSLSAGVSQDTTATSPEATTNFVHFTTSASYDKDGVSPEVPMLGRWADGVHNEPMEFGYDLTSLGERFDQTKPLKYFFIIKTRTGAIGNGHLYKASILNYEFNREDPIEVPFKIEGTIDIEGGQEATIVSVVVPGESLNAPLNATLQGNTLSWTSPEVCSLPLIRYYIYCGGQLVDSTSVNQKSYKVSNAESAYTVAAVYKMGSKLLESEPSNAASRPIILNSTDNKVLSLEQNSIVVPKALNKRYNQATIEFMVKPTALGSSLNRIGDENGNFFINLSASGQISTGWSSKNSSDNGSTAASTIKLNKWYHVAVVIDGGTITTYVDGMKKKTFTSSTYSGLPAMGDFVVGLSDGPMSAQIDELRIWKTARTMQEIYASKDDAVANPSALSDLILYLPMEMIESGGEEKVRDYAQSNHAYFDNESYEQLSDASILTGSKYSAALSIQASSDSIVAGQPVRFTASSPVSTLRWQWEAPGAENEAYTSQAPYIIYNSAGEYTLSLTIQKKDGSTATLTKDITVLPAQLPQVDFEIADEQKSSGEAFCFVNRSTGVGTSYLWKLEGAQIEEVSATNATAIYDVPGQYTVTLTATNSTGSVSKSKTIIVNAAAPTPAFSVNPTSIMLGETTYLTDLSRGTVQNWAWVVDNHSHLLAIDGQNTSFTPTRPGIYDISLSVANEVGQNTLTKKKLLYVTNADPKTALSFTGNERVKFESPLSTNCKAWSIEWWMCPTQFTGAGGFYTENGFCNMHAIADGAYQVKLNNLSLTSSTGYVILNEWHHYAITFSLGTVKFYRDGELWEAPTSKISYSTGKWEGVMSISNSDTPYKGLIDEVRVWSKALTASSVKLNANNPIKNVTDESSLVLYYNFNQGQGNVLDQTLNHNDGVREGFGPDGDAWPTALGVFTLDLEAQTSEKTDVTETYLTNYKRPFLYDESKIVNDGYTDRFYAVEQGTENSGWQVRGAVTGSDGVTTGVHVDKSQSSDLCITTSYYGFGSEVKDHRAYQNIILPAGKYSLYVTVGSGPTALASSYLVATIGSELSTNETLNQSLAYTTLKDGTAIEFLLARETEVSLGMLYNLNYYTRFNIKSITLERQEMDIIEADGETSVYDAIESGTASEAWGREGGIWIAAKQKKNFKIHTLAGQCVFNDEVHGTHFLPFQPGVYLVNGRKVMVK